jgi:DNA-binding NtrC family response regulator
VKRLGARNVKHLDARVIAATNVDVEEMIVQKRFRSDLFYRLAVIRIHIPPLRERRGDVPALARRLLRGICRTKEPPTLDDAELARLQAYAWPGNVRELRNVLERALLLQHGALRPSALVGGAASAPPASVPIEPLEAFPSLAEVEARHVAEALRRSGGNLGQAARALGIALSTLKRHARRPTET